MHCPVCEHRVEAFRSFNGRQGAVCPLCGAKERQRFMALALDELGIFYGSGTRRVLHLKGSEQCLREWMRDRNDDLRFLVDCNLLQIPYADDSVHWIIHNHVMEHIKDDRAAFAEQYRVLRPGLMLVFTVPIKQVNGEFIQEDIELPGKLSKAEREEHYGQADHERYYGMRGVLDKLEEAGFNAAYLSTTEVGVKPVHGIPKYMGCFVARKGLR